MNLHKITSLFLCFSSLCFYAKGQFLFQGKIIDASSSNPIPFASVYVNGSSQGSISNSAGAFAFNSSISNGELIITSVGYQTISYPFNNPKPQNLIIKLDRKNSTLDEILILSDAEKANFLQIFKDNFIGRTNEANATTIKNIRDIYFVRNADKSNGFTAKADSSLVLINKSLGYKISFTLEGFSYNSSQNTTFFYGYTKYDDLLPLRKRYIKRREQVYEGSTMQFFRTLADTTLAGPSFSLMELKSVEYNGKKFDQGTPRTIASLVTKDSSDSNIFHLKFKERLRVLYTRPTTVFNDLSSNRYMNIGIAGVPVSTLNLLEEAIYFDKNGVVLNPLGMMLSGYWSFEKAANMLPSDYKPLSVIN